ncbi:MAG: DUF1294 domain-containing protein [Clostridiales bacterium]|nr:DUF1294 domain-containing protein [Clostridiales bacterium]
MTIFWIFLSVVGAASVIAFFAYLIDKQRAIGGRWRIRESFLLGLGFIGGATGALVAMKLFRHKTRHWYFWAANIFFLALHITAAVLILVKFVF